ncbi:unnamed protein product [Dimorphilus gyrociliatus]|uniref:Uncharacterized protein n=1 Tax=Dimorphilus gyrociliatus TaxID=2664684 RepID=A0A7I8WBA1_9ANNE|nr:unnamed protein product [Dimorphilus gyrociliatus]
MHAVFFLKDAHKSDGNFLSVSPQSQISHHICALRLWRLSHPLLLDGIGAPVIRRHKGQIAKVGRLDKAKLVHVSNEIDMQRAGGNRLTGEGCVQSIKTVTKI